ncbi:hypothetical protein ACROYT_G015576 [Oculina patagonica]
MSERAEEDISAELSEECSLSKDVQGWSTEDVHSWLTKEGFHEEAVVFKAENITGKSLYCLEKADLKDIGINPMGKRLEIFEKIKELTCLQSEKKASSKSEVTGQVWKKKITKADRSTWKPNEKACYLEKISIINQEARQLWPGNSKIHIKGDATTRLKMEELITRMEPMCSIPEIGFGRDAIKSHLLQWFHEKNRKIEDGYDYEATHKPAKRAKRSFSPKGSDTDSTLSPYSSSTGSLSSPTEDDEEDNSPTPSSDIDDISAHSAEVVVLKAFDALSIHFLTVKKHFYPLGKVLKVKCRSIGKYQLVVPLAKALITKGHVDIEGDVNYKKLEKSQVKVLTDINSLISDETRNSPVSDVADNDSPPCSQVSSQII